MKKKSIFVSGMVFTAMMLSTAPVNATASGNIGLPVSSSSNSGFIGGVKHVQDPWLSKPVLGYLIDTQDEKLENDVKDLKQQLSLNDQQMDRLMQIGHIESFAVRQVDKDKKKVTAKEYNAKVDAVVKQSDSEVKQLLGLKYNDFRSWIEEWFAGEAANRTAQSMRPNATNGGSGTTKSIWATQYDAYSTYEVALPDQNLKVAYSNNSGYTVNIARDTAQTTVYVKEVGPWNVNDNYWDYYRREFTDLLQYDSESYEAYYNNYNNGYDDLGYKVSNPAGIDLSPAVASILGMGTNVSAFIDVNFSSLP